MRPNEPTAKPMFANSLPADIALHLSGNEFKLKRVCDYQKHYTPPFVDGPGADVFDRRTPAARDLFQAREYLRFGHAEAVISSVQKMVVSPGLDIAPHWRVLRDACALQRRGKRTWLWNTRLRAQKSLQDAILAGDHKATVQLIQRGARPHWGHIAEDRRADYRFRPQLTPEVLDAVLSAVENDFEGWEAHRRQFWQAALNWPDDSMVEVLKRHPVRFDADVQDHLDRWGTKSAHRPRNVVAATEGVPGAAQGMKRAAGSRADSGALASVEEPTPVSAWRRIVQRLWSLVAG